MDDQKHSDTFKAKDQDVRLSSLSKIDENKLEEIKFEAETVLNEFIIASILDPKVMKNDGQIHHTKGHNDCHVHKSKKDYFICADESGKLKMRSTVKNSEHYKKLSVKKSNSSWWKKLAVMTKI